MLGIVITAYNRAEPLAQLLESLNNIKNIDNIQIPLVISIDNKGTTAVNKVAYDFNWKHGTKEVIVHPDKLGLVKHFIWAGDQTERFEHVIFLEDDLLVSPELINYSIQLIDYYEYVDDVAAASLYNPILNEATDTRFYQLEDNYDVYFLQHPYWGNIWFKNKWSLFKEYLDTYEENKCLLPKNIRNWNSSFKKKYIQYLIESGKTVVTPRISVVTNNGVEGGLHSDFGMYMYQVNLKLRGSLYKFCTPSDSISCYDANEEIYPNILKELNPVLIDYDFIVDIHGEKDIFNRPYILTSKPSKNAIIKFTSLMKPIELGVVLNSSGNEMISLSKVEDIELSDRFYQSRKILDMYKNYYMFKPSFSEVKTILFLFIKRIINHFVKKLNF